MTLEAFGELAAAVCKVFRWLTRRKPNNDTFLIVEDNEHDAIWIKQKLTKRGRKCELATSGEAAAGLVQHTHYACIFVDMRLPRMSGEALLQILSEHAPNAAVVVVAGEPSDLKQLPSGQPVLFIRKPISLEGIDDALKLLRL
jgi:CheY-like chemotaxis protein